MATAPHQASLFNTPDHNSSPDVHVLIVSSAAARYDQLASRRVAGCRFSRATSGAGALSMLAAEDVQIAVMDGALPDLDSGEITRMILSSYPRLSVLAAGCQAGGISFQPLRTLHPEAGAILAALHQTPAGGAGSGPEKSLLPSASDSPADSYVPACDEPGNAPSELLPRVIGTSPSMGLVSRLVRLVAPRNSTVLLLGETGTGKERIARAIHEVSPRQRQPFVVVNCGAIPETLFEAELFGFERGAFTGAQQSRMGKIQAARGGTLFLDEVGELPLAMQAKLLRFLQEREVQRLGSTETLRLDVRVVAATNANLPRLCETGSFRSDLYYRLNVFPIALPPLRQRRDDILVLARHFLRRFCRESASSAKRFTDQAAEALRSYNWPGNVRELEHVIERAFIFSETSSEVHVDLDWQATSAPASMAASAERIPPARLGSATVENELPAWPTGAAIAAR